jgi:DNA repair exonuclease SbcCD ATPase subunit
MTIHSIDLNNFRKHRHFTTLFGEGLTACTGPNYAGKSTLLKAVMFALFGVSATGHKAERIPTRGTTDSTSVVLDIEIPIHGRVRIVRTLKGAKVFSMDDTLLANGTTPTVKLIEEAYGMAASDLQMLMYSKQGQSQAMLEFGATILQQTVERLAKSDLVDKVLGLVGKDVTSMEGQLTGLGEVEDLGKLHDDVDRYQRLVGSDNALLTEATESLRAMQEAETDFRGRYEQTQMLTNKLEQLNYAISARSDRVKALNVSIQETTATLEGLEGFEPDLAERANTEAANIEALQKTWLNQKQTLDQAQKLRARIDSLTEKHEQLRQIKEVSDTVAGKLGDAEGVLAQMNEESTRLGLACDAAKILVGAAREAVDKSVCHECQRPFNEEERLAAIKRQEEAVDAYDALYRQWSDLQTPLHAQKAEVASLRKAYNPAAEQLLKDAEQQMFVAWTDFAAIMRGYSIEKLAEVAANSKDAVDQAHIRWADLSERVKTQTILQTRLRDLEQRVTEELTARHEHEAELAALPTAEDVTKLRLLLDQSVQQIRGLQDRQSTLQTQVAGNQIRLAAAEKALERAEKAEASRKCLTIEVDLRKRLQVWLRKSRAELMVELWDNMLAYASHLISTTTDGLPDGRLTQVFREEGELFVVEDGYKMAVSELSGFQRSLVGLAIRIAMSRTFYGEDHFLLLDEPTSDANDESAARIAGMLQGLGSQVIYVTHREGDAMNAGTVISL